MGFLDLAIIAIIAFILWLWFKLKEKEDGQFSEKVAAIINELLESFQSKKDAAAAPTEAASVPSPATHVSSTASVVATAVPVDPQPSTSSVRTALPQSTRSAKLRLDKGSFRGNDKSEISSSYERGVPRGIDEDRLGAVKAKTPTTSKKTN